MNAWRQVFTRRLGNSQLEGLLAGWSFGVAGISLLVLMAVKLPVYAASAGELVFGLAAALNACLMMILAGMLTARRQAVLANRSLPWHSQWVELVSAAIFLGLLLFGVRYLATLEFTQAQIMIGLLLLLSLGTSIWSLAAWSALARQLKS
jgi:amino acid transporter